MIKVTIITDYSKSTLYYYEDDVQIEHVRKKVLSQMNNGHTVVLGEEGYGYTFINPKHIRAISFQWVTDDQKED